MLKFTRDDLGTTKFGIVLMQEVQIRQSSTDPFKQTKTKIYVSSFEGSCPAILKDDPVHSLEITSLRNTKSSP